MGSSNFCSRPVDVSKHAYIYAGIQKNLGPAGMSVGFIRPDFATGAHELPICPMGGKEELEKKFLDGAKKEKLYTLAGHRSVGGCRASLYNGMPVEGVEKLRDFMKSFMDENRK